MNRLKRVSLSALFIFLLGLPSFAFARGGVDDLLVGLFIPLIIIIIIFLICRELVCWYWKINETLSVLKEIRDLLKRSPLASNMEDSSKNKNSSPKKIIQVDNAPKGPGGPGHHWGENDKTQDIIKNCPKCNGIFHGDEFEVCGECGCLLVDPDE
jgi:hypothetical protein